MFKSFLLLKWALFANPTQGSGLFKPFFGVRLANPAQGSTHFGVQFFTIAARFCSRNEPFLEQNRAAIVKMGPQNERIPERDWQAERQKWA